MYKWQIFLSILAVVAMLSQRNYYDYQIEKIKLSMKKGKK